MSCWLNFHHMDSLRIFSSKLALESLQALLEQFVEHQLMSLLFECVLIIGYPSHSEGIIQGRNFEYSDSLSFNFLYSINMVTSMLVTDVGDQPKSDKSHQHHCYHKYQSSEKCFRCLATNSFRRGYHGTLDRLWTNYWSGYGCECMSAMLPNTGERRNCEKNSFERRISVVIFRCNDSWIYQLMCLSTN